MFGVDAPDVLQATGVHTALYAGPTPLDRVVFLADKIEWDQDREPPYRAELLAAVHAGLDAGTRFMLSWLHKYRADLLVILLELRQAWAAHGIP